MSPELRGDWPAVTVLHPGAGQTALGQPEIKTRTGGSRGLVTGRAPGTGTRTGTCLQSKARGQGPCSHRGCEPKRGRSCAISGDAFKFLLKRDEYCPHFFNLISNQVCFCLQLITKNRVAVARGALGLISNSNFAIFQTKTGTGKSGWAGCL